jgi:flagellar hook-length control protein FliK
MADPFHAKDIAILPGRGKELVIHRMRNSASPTIRSRRRIRAVSPLAFPAIQHGTADGRPAAAPSDNAQTTESGAAFCRSMDADETAETAHPDAAVDSAPDATAPAAGPVGAGPNLAPRPVKDATALSDTPRNGGAAALRSGSSSAAIAAIEPGASASFDPTAAPNTRLAGHLVDVEQVARTAWADAATPRNAASVAAEAAGTARKTGAARIASAIAGLAPGRAVAEGMESVDAQGPNRRLAGAVSPAIAPRSDQAAPAQRPDAGGAAPQPAAAAPVPTSTVAPVMSPVRAAATRAQAAGDADTTLSRTSASAADGTPAATPTRGVEAAPAMAPRPDGTATAPIATSRLAEGSTEIRPRAAEEADFGPGADTRTAAPTGPAAADRPGSAGTADAAVLARSIARQIGAAVANDPGRPIEIELEPRELGRVRMVMTLGDHGLTMTVAADRPDTLDLMRRHIDLLARDFQALGYRELTLSFADPGGTEPGQHGNARPDPALTDNPEAPARADNGEAAAPGPGHAEGRLDIRL